MDFVYGRHELLTVLPRNEDAISNAHHRCVCEMASKLVLVDAQRSE